MFQLIVVSAPLCETTSPSSTSAGDGDPVPAQTPPVQTSLSVQVLASLHALPSAFAGLEHPDSGAQVPASWQVSLAVHVRGLPPWQAPDTQPSLVVQRLPSLQGVPFGAVGFEQMPVAGAHVPAWWQASVGAHRIGFVPWHAPEEHTST
jgi:hypothetical protein